MPLVTVDGLRLTDHSFYVFRQDITLFQWLFGTGPKTGEVRSINGHLFVASSWDDFVEWKPVDKDFDRAAFTKELLKDYLKGGSDGQERLTEGW